MASRAALAPLFTEMPRRRVFSETQGIRRAGAVRPRPSKVRFAYTGIASANLAVLRLAHSLQVLADHLQGALKLLLGAELDGLAVLYSKDHNG